MLKFLSSQELENLLFKLSLLIRAPARLWRKLDNNNIPIFSRMLERCYLQFK